MTIDEVKRQLFVNSDDVLGNNMVDLDEAQNCCDTSFCIGYNKAIDDFTEKLMEQQIYDCMLPDGFRTDIVTSHTIDAIAEQIKAGDGE